MSLDTALLGRCVSDLMSVNSLQQRFDVYVNYVHELNFEGASYSLYSHLHRECFADIPLTFIHSSDFPESFIEHYTAERFDQQDFTIRYNVSGQRAPMDWHECIRAGRVTAEETHVLEVARYDYGMRNGITIPTLNLPIGIAGASIISSETDSRFQALKAENLETLTQLTRVFHDIAYANYQYRDIFVSPILTEFTPKELKVLRYMASGKPMKAIGSEGISFSYAMNLLSDMRTRLGGINNDRLMYLFGLTQLLNSD
ncbi:autoinducer binding domain-containing protein [Thiofilum flexile]|uniref:autoinducer binding domain-containing protein n=1 Tax=Thiofilum flexile TaxID=125627 RepID=UPI00036C979D|nr:autoinducer binding domain-containing protein [Thiofilum flexile]